MPTLPNTIYSYGNTGSSNDTYLTFTNDLDETRQVGLTVPLKYAGTTDYTGIVTRLNVSNDGSWLTYGTNTPQYRVYSLRFPTPGDLSSAVDEGYASAPADLYRIWGHWWTHDGSYLWVNGDPFLTWSADTVVYKALATTKYDASTVGTWSWEYGYRAAASSRGLSTVVDQDWGTSNLEALVIRFDRINVDTLNAVWTPTDVASSVQYGPGTMPSEVVSLAWAGYSDVTTDKAFMADDGSDYKIYQYSTSGNAWNTTQKTYDGVSLHYGSETTSPRAFRCRHARRWHILDATTIYQYHLGSDWRINNDGSFAYGSDLTTGGFSSVVSFDWSHNGSELCVSGLVSGVGYVLRVFSVGSDPFDIDGIAKNYDLPLYRLHPDGNTGATFTLIPKGTSNRLTICDTSKVVDYVLETADLYTQDSIKWTHLRNDANFHFDHISNDGSWAYRGRDNLGYQYRYALRTAYDGLSAGSDWEEFVNFGTPANFGAQFGISQNGDRLWFGNGTVFDAWDEYYLSTPHNLSSRTLVGTTHLTSRRDGPADAVVHSGSGDTFYYDSDVGGGGHYLNSGVANNGSQITTDNPFPPDFAGMVTAKWRIEYSVTGPVDDDYDLTGRIISYWNGAGSGSTSGSDMYVLAANGSDGSHAALVSNITNTTDNTGSGTWPWVNTAVGSDVWRGAIWEFRQEYTKSKGGDAEAIQIDFAALLPTSTYKSEKQGLAVRAAVLFRANDATGQVAGGTVTGYATRAAVDFRGNAATSAVGGVTRTATRAAVDFRAHAADWTLDQTATVTRAAADFRGNDAVGVAGGVTATALEARFDLRAHAAGFAVGAVSRAATEARFELRAQDATAVPGPISETAVEGRATFRGGDATAILGPVTATATEARVLFRAEGADGAVGPITRAVTRAEVLFRAQTATGVESVTRAVTEARVLLRGHTATYAVGPVSAVASPARLYLRAQDAVGVPGAVTASVTGARFVLRGQDATSAVGGVSRATTGARATFRAHAAGYAVGGVSAGAQGARLLLRGHGAQAVVGGQTVPVTRAEFVLRAHSAGAQVGAVSQNATEARLVLRAADAVGVVGGIAAPATAARFVLRAEGATSAVGGVTATAQPARLLLRAGAAVAVPGAVSETATAARALFRGNGAGYVLGGQTVPSQPARFVLRAHAATAVAGPVTVTATEARVVFRAHAADSNVTVIASVTGARFDLRGNPATAQTGPVSASVSSARAIFRAPDAIGSLGAITGIADPARILLRGNGVTAELQTVADTLVARFYVRGQSAGWLAGPVSAAVAPARLYLRAHVAGYISGDIVAVRSRVRFRDDFPGATAKSRSGGAASFAGGDSTATLNDEIDEY